MAKKSSTETPIKPFDTVTYVSAIGTTKIEVDRRDAVVRIGSVVVVPDAAASARIADAFAEAAKLLTDTESIIAAVERLNARLSDSEIDKRVASLFADAGTKLIAALRNGGDLDD